MRAKMRLLSVNDLIRQEKRGLNRKVQLLFFGRDHRQQSQSLLSAGQERLLDCISRPLSPRDNVTDGFK